MALTAAREYRQAFPDGVNYLNRLTADRLHPYTPLMQQIQFAQAGTADLLCDSGFQIAGRAICNGEERAKQARRTLRGKIAVVGWDGVAQDMFKTPIGSMAADILNTAVTPTWSDIEKLAAIAAFRTALNYFLEREIRQEASPEQLQAEAVVRRSVSNSAVQSNETAARQVSAKFPLHLL